MLYFRLKKHLNGFSIDVELELNEEFTVLFGPSGAGKSILLNMISGIVKPDEGRVVIDGRTVFDSTEGIDLPIRKRKIGHLFQDYTVFPHMTVYENIAYGIDHLPEDWIKRRVEELLSLMRLEGFESRYPHELSGGQKQRVALARTLATEPKTLFLDEPFSQLDNQVREKIRFDLIDIHRRFPITTIFVTHDLEEAFMLGEKIAVINNGRLEQVGTKDDVFFRPMTRNVARFVGTRNIFDGYVKHADTTTLTVECKGMGELVTFQNHKRPFRRDQPVTFVIRPEEIVIIRPDRPYGNTENVLTGSIASMVGRGATQILYVSVTGGDRLLKVEVPNLVVRKLDLAINKQVRVLLKKESIWVIPLD